MVFGGFPPDGEIDLQALGHGLDEAAAVAGYLPVEGIGEMLCVVLIIVKGHILPVLYSVDLLAVKVQQKVVVLRQGGIHFIPVDSLIVVAFSQGSVLEYSEDDVFVLLFYAVFKVLYSFEIFP